MATMSGRVFGSGGRWDASLRIGETGWNYLARVVAPASGDVWDRKGAAASVIQRQRCARALR